MERNRKRKWIEIKILFIQVTSPAAAAAAGVLVLINLNGFSGDYYPQIKCIAFGLTFTCAAFIVFLQI